VLRNRRASAWGEDCVRNAATQTLGCQLVDNVSIVKRRQRTDPFTAIEDFIRAGEIGAGPYGYTKCVAGRGSLTASMKMSSFSL
jgi:hypothetical protein